MVNRLNSLTQSKKLKRLAWVGLWCVLIWFGLFRWNVFDGYGDGTHLEPMFSPNCDYYITTHQTVWERLFDSHWPNLTGTARLHNKAGAVLYEGRTDFDEHSPLWIESEEKGEVLMRGLGPQGHWESLLPTSPGSKWKARNCAKFEEETQALNAMTQRPELTIPLKECSFKFSNVFKGWFLRGKQYFNSSDAYYEGVGLTDLKTNVEIWFYCFTEQEHEQNEIQSKVPSRGIIKAVNASGRYKLNVDEQGEIAFRGCLPNGKYVLCANEYSVGNVNHPEQDLTPYMLKLLESVEFVPETLEGKE